MNETFVEQNALMEGVDQQLPRVSTTRRQLILAALFPLVLFGLLAAILMASSLYELTLQLVLQRNTAQVQFMASGLDDLETSTAGGMQGQLQVALGLLQKMNNAALYVFDSGGNLLGSSVTDMQKISLRKDDLLALAGERQPSSRLLSRSDSEDQVIVSFAPIDTKGLELILVEPWSNVTAPAFYYQLILAFLLILGTVFSLNMLSLSIGRVLRPIRLLADNAGRAVPGSLFYPMAEDGPLEVRTLIRAFNQMVIRLAEQQTTLRQFAHQALLSQEEERQRLSHELHDGTVQDLVGLSQRVELCRTELGQDPVTVIHRLDELHILVERCLSDVRRISNALRPSILEDLGLSVALKSLCTDLEKQVPSIKCSCKIIGDERRLPPDLELAIFRVVQEALANIRKHVPEAKYAEVELAYKELEVQVSVCNDGLSLQEPDVRSLVRSGHLGLAGMYERARLFHGRLEIASGVNGGSQIQLHLPYPPATDTVIAAF
jgi:two-component system sensor histidine kinase DegS